MNTYSVRLVDNRWISKCATRYMLTILVVLSRLIGLFGIPTRPWSREYFFHICNVLPVFCCVSISVAPVHRLCAEHKTLWTAFAKHDLSKKRRMRSATHAMLPVKDMGGVQLVDNRWMSVCATRNTCYPNSCSSGKKYSSCSVLAQII